jgi:hypothetical protein
LRFHFADRAAVAVEQFAALLSQRDDQATAVRLVAVALDQPPRLEGGDHVCH